MALAFQPFQKLLHGRVMRRTAAGVKPVGQQSPRDRTLLPENLQDGQLGIRDILRRACHGIFAHRRNV